MSIYVATNLVIIYTIVTMKRGGTVATIVYQKNKKTGVVYAYESVSYWDKDKNSLGRDENALAG